MSWFSRKKEPEYRGTDDDAFIFAVYQGLLGRKPDPTGLASFRKGIQDGTMTWASVLGQVVGSDEFRHSYARINQLRRLHEARVMLFSKRLPPARRVLDLGGAADNNPEGALFAMGYPHTPELLTIVDLPPAERFTGQDGAEKVQSLQAKRGTRVEYVHRSMADLDFAADNSYDLIVSGESIEHITEQDADKVCAHAFRILEPGGSFCLDTPNGIAARIQAPHALLHPEHKIEYRPEQLREKLHQAGFEVVEEFGLCPIPESIRRREFLWMELFMSTEFCDNPDEGYVFYMRARKPVR